MRLLRSILPFDYSRLLGDTGLPTVRTGATRQTYYEGNVAVPESSLPRIYDRSSAVEAKLAVGAEAHGVVATLGDAGWSHYLDPQRRPVFTYRLYNIGTVTLTGSAPLTVGENVVRPELRL